MNHPQDIHAEEIRALQQQLAQGHAGASSHRKSYAYVLELPVALESGRAMDLLTDLLRHFDHMACTRFGNGRMFLELPSHKYSAAGAMDFLSQLQNASPDALAQAINHLREKRMAVLYTLHAGMRPAAVHPRTTLHPAAIQPLGTLAPASHHSGQGKAH